MSFEQVMFDQMYLLPKIWSCSGYITIIRKNICQKTRFQSVDQTDQIYAGCKNLFDEMSFDQLTYDLSNIVEMVLWQLSNVTSRKNVWQRLNVKISQLSIGSKPFEILSFE